MGKRRFVVKISAPGLRPETIAMGDLADLMRDLEQSILKACAEEPERELSQGAIVSLVGIEEGSDKLIIAVDPELEAAARGVTEAVATNCYSQLPSESHESLYRISQLAAKCAWCVLFTDGDWIRDATISRDHPVEAPAREEICGTTTFYGTCLRVGGAKEPKAEIRPLRGGRAVNVSLTEDMAKQLGRRLYEQVAVSGEATWRVRTWEVLDFRVTRMLPYNPTGAVEGFARLRKISAGCWDGVSAMKYVLQQRKEGGGLA